MENEIMEPIEALQPRQLSQGEVLNLVCVNLAVQGGQLARLESENRRLKADIVTLNTKLNSVVDILNSFAKLHGYDYSETENEWKRLY